MLVVCTYHRDFTNTLYVHVAILLTNYRCHDTILRLPSMLFFESTLQAHSIAELHPSCTSALEFVCTSLDQNRLYNCPDFDDMEAVILLEQVKPLCVLNMWLSKGSL